MDKNRATFALLLLAVLAGILPSHFIGIDRFATIDEPWWVISGSNYYYALTHGDFESTLYDYHPAVTTTWVVTAGMLSYFPEYRGFGQGYFDVRKEHFEDFMREHAKEALGLLRASRLIQSALIALFAVAAWLLLAKIIQPAIALLAVVLAMNAPYFLGHSRLLNHEGMLTMFVILSVLSMLVYLQERRGAFLAASAVAFGLAQLTKSSSIVVFGVVGLMLLVDLLQRDPRGFTREMLLTSARDLGLWLLGAAVVYLLLWPGMWAAPGKMLYEVYGNAFSYALGGARLEVVESAEPSGFDLSGIAMYLGHWLMRSTPVTWLGVVAAAVVLRAGTVSPPAKRLIGYLALTAALFILMFGIAKGRNSGHYIMTSFVCLDLIAGMGWGYGLMLLADRVPAVRQTWMRAAAFTALIVAQLASALPYYPYYFTYENPLVSSGNSTGYGEGLELAAAYLAEKPDAALTRTFVYAGMGTFSFFYPGRTEVFKKAYLLEHGLPSVIEEMKRADYLVVYSAIQEAQPESVRFLKVMESVEPDYEVLIRGAVVARIYRIIDVPESVYDSLAATDD